MRIVVDEREKSSDLPNFIRELGGRVDFAQLEVGDYILSNECGIERKSIKDLIRSVYDGRLFDQIFRLQEEFDMVFLLIEGDLKEIEEYSENPKAIYGALISLLLNTKVRLIPSPNPLVSAQLILTLAEHLQRKRGVGGPLIRKGKKGENLYQQQLNLISSLPGVGERLAKRLLEVFGTPKRIFNASLAELARVKGFGYARAEKVLRTLETRYKKEEVIQKRLEDLE
ncbi:UvrABC system protein C [archaeon HR06]|nr:UvrABC system protein C [archaeon HR06]